MTITELRALLDVAEEANRIVSWDEAVCAKNELGYSKLRSALAKLKDTP